MNLLDKLNTIEKEIHQLMEASQEFALESEKFAKLDFGQNLITYPEYIKIGNVTKGDFSDHALIPLKYIKGIAFETNRFNREAINATIESIAIQIASAMDPEYYDITIIDPKQLGNSFKSIKKIASRIIYDEEQVGKAIEFHKTETIRIIHDCLANYPNIQEYNSAKIGRTIPYRFIFIADFPYGIRDNFDKIISLLNTCKDTGVFFFIALDKSISTHYQDKKEEITKQLMIMFPEKETKDNIIYKIDNNAKKDFYNKKFQTILDKEYIEFHNLKDRINSLLTNNAKTLSFNIEEGIRIPIGTCAGQKHFLTIGLETDNFHGIIGGQPGKGKTVLLNNIIARGIEQYTSNELNFVLIDCAGVGFQEYRDDSHILKLCNSSDLEQCVEAVEFIDSLLSEREQLFKDNMVTELKDYIRKTGKPLPRILCIIDEFHVLFSGRYATKIENILVQKLIRIGRKFGIHLIACTQSLGSGVRRSVLDNIPLRIALGMTEEQSTSFLSLGNRVASNLDRGQAVYNNSNGESQGNKIIHINNITSDEILTIIKKQ